MVLGNPKVEYYENFEEMAENYNKDLNLFPNLDIEDILRELPERVVYSLNQYEQIQVIFLDTEEDKEGSDLSFCDWGDKMIFIHKVLKSTSFNEIVAYLCGKEETSVKGMQGRQGNGNFVKIDPYDIFESKIDNLTLGEIEVYMENSRTFFIEVDRLSPGLSHYVLKVEPDEDTMEVIAGCV